MKFRLIPNQLETGKCNVFPVDLAGIRKDLTQKKTTLIQTCTQDKQISVSYQSGLIMIVLQSVPSSF